MKKKFKIPTNIPNNKPTILYLNEYSYATPETKNIVFKILKNIKNGFIN